MTSVNMNIIMFKQSSVVDLLDGKIKLINKPFTNTSLLHQFLLLFNLLPKPRQEFGNSASRSIKLPTIQFLQTDFLLINNKSQKVIYKWIITLLGTNKLLHLIDGDNIIDSHNIHELTDIVLCHTPIAYVLWIWENFIFFYFLHPLVIKKGVCWNIAE